MSREYITRLDLIGLGYDKKMAHSIMTRLRTQLYAKQIPQYKIITRNGESHERLTYLTAVRSESAVKLCRQKLKQSEFNKWINKAQWEELLSKLSA